MQTCQNIASEWIETPVSSRWKTYKILKNFEKKNYFSFFYIFGKNNCLRKIL